MCRTPFQRSEVTKIHLEQRARSSSATNSPSDSSTKLARELHDRINSFVQTGASTSVAHSLTEDCKTFFQENSSTDVRNNSLAEDSGANGDIKHQDFYATYQLLNNLLSDDTRLQEKRRSRARQNPQGNATDDDLRKAIKESKRTAEDRDLQEALRLSRDLRKAIKESKRTAGDRDLQEALRLSREEEEKRKKAVQNSTESARFDDNNQLYVAKPNLFPFRLVSWTDLFPTTVSR
jgi:hypothetical protein